MAASTERARPRGLGWAKVAWGLAIGLSVGLVLWIGVWDGSSDWVQGLTLGLLALWVIPIQRAVRHRARVSWRRHRDRERAVARLTTELRSEVELPSIAEKLLAGVRHLVGIQWAELYLVERSGSVALYRRLGVANSTAQPQSGVQPAGSDDPAVRLPTDETLTLYLSLVATTSKGPKRIGALVLGPLGSGEGYSQRLRLLLAELAADAAVSIHVAQLTEAKRESEERLSLALTNASLALWDVVLPEQQVTVNRRGAELLGRVSEAAASDVFNLTIRQVADALDRRDRAEVLGKMGEHLEERLELFEVEARIVDTAGTVRWILAQGKLVERDEQGMAVRVVGIARDITQVRRHREEREGLIRQLAARTGEIEQFLALASHELKSPLFTIQGNLGLLRKANTEHDEQTERSLARIEGAANTLAQQLEGVLRVAGAARDDRSFREIPLADLLAEAVEDVVGDREQPEVAMGRDLPAIWGDPQGLHQVFVSLLDNASKFAAKGPPTSIEIDANTEGDWVHCWVRDRGPGIEPAYHDRVFRLFEQLDPSVPGLGLGLPLARRVVERHGGRIWIEPAATDGCTVHLTLPVAGPIAASEAGRMAYAG